MSEFECEYCSCEPCECVFIRGQRWISVNNKDKWPKENETILLYNDHYVFEGQIGWFENGIPVWCCNEFMRRDNITHWMPLPLPPKKENE